MPIYNKREIIQIKHKNIYPVLIYNSMTRPNSASARVLQAQRDPQNNLKRKFYRNSNKPLGNSIKNNDLFSKRESTTIKTLFGELSEQKKRIMSKTKSMHNLMWEKDPDNSMLKSDFVDQKDIIDDQVIIEKDEEEGGEIVKEH